MEFTEEELERLRQVILKAGAVKKYEFRDREIEFQSIPQLLQLLDRVQRSTPGAGDCYTLSVDRGF